MIMKNSKLNLCLLSGLLGSLLFASNAHALKKWVDENGQVHYGDRVPAKYLSKEHSTLNDQGITVRTSKTLKTEEQLNLEEQQRALKAEEDKKRLIEQRKKALRDRVLLDTFTTEKDLSLARDARIEAVDSQISLAETLIKNDERKLEDVKKRINDIESSGRIAPENLHKEVTSVSRQLENNYAFIEDKNNERNEIMQSFNEDVARFRELMKEKQKAREKARDQQLNNK